MHHSRHLCRAGAPCHQAVTQTEKRVGLRVIKFIKECINFPHSVEVLRSQKSYI